MAAGWVVSCHDHSSAPFVSLAGAERFLAGVVALGACGSVHAIVEVAA